MDKKQNEEKLKDFQKQLECAENTEFRSLMGYLFRKERIESLKKQIEEIKTEPTLKETNPC